jgi:hypothetical protein
MESLLRKRKMGDPTILNKPRLPIKYDYNDKIPNPFLERFGKFDNHHFELIDVFDENLAFAVYNLMRWKGGPLKLAPFQSVVLDTLWNKTFPIVLMTRGGGKTFMLAVYALLRAMMVPGSKIVIVAASFRQSKLVFDYIKQIHDYSPLVQQAVTRIHQPNDQSLMEIADGLSTIRALPLGNGEKIRGIRATDIVTDEFASIPEEIFQVVVRGFAAVAADPILAAEQLQLEEEMIAKGIMREEDRKRIKGNKIIYAGTASYQFNHYYKLYTTHRRIIESKFIGDARNINDEFDVADDSIEMDGHLDYRDYAVIQIPYTGLPRGFMDEKQINQAFATMPKALFQMEYECQFPSDSDGFFKSSEISDATPPLDGGAFQIEQAGDNNYEYVMGIDPARKTDNFAISILKIYPGKGVRNVFCWSMNNKNFVTCVKKIRELMSKFNIVRIAMDAGGGGYSVEDLMQNIEVIKGELPVWRYDDPEHARFDGLHILDMVNFVPSWIRDANYGLAADIEHRRMLFPRRDPKLASDDAVEDEIWGEIDEQIRELCMIVVSSTKTGVEHFDLPDLPTTEKQTISAGRRKDRYSALLLAAYAARTYISEGQVTFIPEPGDWIDHI